MKGIYGNRMFAATEIRCASRKASAPKAIIEVVRADRAPAYDHSRAVAEFEAWASTPTATRRQPTHNAEVAAPVTRIERAQHGNVAKRAPVGGNSRRVGGAKKSLVLAYG